MANPRNLSVCSSCLRTLQPQQQAVRAFSASSPHQTVSSAPDIPRWRQTPPAMRMPFRVRPDTRQPVWRVNDKMEPLDEMYDRFIGRAGDAAKGQEGVQGTKGSELLPEEVKWLAVTHKSFDHGRRGFNDRLAFLGKRIIDLQTSLALLNAPVSPTSTSSPSRNADPAHAGLANITQSSKFQTLDSTRLAKLALSYGMDRVVRWKPRKSENLQSSGIDVVLAHAVYSIIGALALQRGGEVATRTARERVLQPLGLR